MINLLAPETKLELRAAKRNVLLRRYFVLILLISLAMGIVFGVGYYLSWHEQQMARNERTEQLEQVKQFATVRSQANIYTKNLSTAKTIISKQTSPSKFLTDLAALLPQNVILSSVTLTSTPTAANKLTTFKARAKSFNDVLALKQKLEDSPLFETVSIVTLQQQDSSQPVQGIERAYPVDATISLKISAGAGISS